MGNIFQMARSGLAGNLRSLCEYSSFAFFEKRLRCNVCMCASSSSARPEKEPNRFEYCWPRSAPGHAISIKREKNEIYDTPAS